MPWVSTQAAPWPSTVLSDTTPGRRTDQARGETIKPTGSASVPGEAWVQLLEVASPCYWLGATSDQADELPCGSEGLWAAGWLAELTQL